MTGREHNPCLFLLWDWETGGKIGGVNKGVQDVLL